MANDDDMSFGAPLQAANIGVGIMGHEGRQAVNNSDFAIGQFRCVNVAYLSQGDRAS